MKREISPGLAIGIIVGLIVLVALGNWAWKGLFRAKKANIVFHSNGAVSGGAMSPRDRMLLQIYQSARTVGGNAPPTSAPPPPTSPASRTP